MRRHASGSFEIELQPMEQQPHPDGIALGRYSLDKHYHGELEAVASGQMLTASTAVEGSAAYVAMERVEGTLDGLKGSFALQHRGVMSGAGQSLEVGVVPDSGTGELVGLEGTLEITVVDGRHTYELDYTLPDRR